MDIRWDLYLICTLPVQLHYKQIRMIRYIDNVEQRWTTLNKDEQRFWRKLHKWCAGNLLCMPENVADLRLIIQASAPQSNGISRAYSKAVQIGAAREVVDEMINIKDDYEAVHGAVTEAAPKVFLKYFYVNTKTGEKSGEMLATVKLG